MVDFTRLERESRQQESHALDKRTKREVAIVNAVDRMLTADPDSSDVEAVEIILHIKRGDRDAILKLLGIELSTTSETPDAPRALEAPGARKSLDDFWYVYEEDGVTPATDLQFVLRSDTETMKANALIPLLDDTNTQVGLKKRGFAPPAARVKDNLENEVPILNKKGADTHKRIKVREGIGDDALEAIPTDDGTGIKAFREKPRVAVTRRRS